MTGKPMTEKQKQVMSKLMEAVEPLDDNQLDDLLKIGEGMALMKDIMLGKNKEMEKVAG